VTGAVTFAVCVTTRVSGLVAADGSADREDEGASVAAASRTVATEFGRALLSVRWDSALA
jgi:hypothetical protein